MRLDLRSSGQSLGQLYTDGTESVGPHIRAAPRGASVIHSRSDQWRAAHLPSVWAVIVPEALPRPLPRRVPPKPQVVVIRHFDTGESIEVVASDTLQRRKEEAEWQRYRQSHGLDMREEHAKLALGLGDPLTVPGYTRDIWWFVVDVNGIDKTVSAATLLFDQPRERTFPFELVELAWLFGGHETREADACRSRLGLPCGLQAEQRFRAA